MTNLKSRPLSSRTLLALITILTAAVFTLGSCAGGGGSSVPSWLTSYPADSAFYVGIGGSNTGNLAEDREKAAAAARADLAAQISAQVSSELDISSSATSEGDFSESVARRVNESVEQNLKSVETVDSWIHPEQGAWVYVRLSKAVWAAIVNEEIADLTLRANAMLQPVAAGNQSEAEDLAALGRAREVLLSSPWGLAVKDETLGRGGFLRDSIDGEISERTGSMTVAGRATPSRIKFGSEVTITGSTASGSGRTMGAFPLLLSAGTEESSVVTEPDGSYSVTLAPGTLEPGTVRVVLSPDLASWGIPPEGFPVVQSAVEIVIDPVLLALTVNSAASEYLPVLTGAVEDWVSELPLPAEIVGSGRGDTDLEFAWTVFDFPRSDRLANAPYISQVGAILTVSRNGNVIFVKEVDPFKDGGLDWNQAHQRSARGLLDKLADDTVLAEELTEALGL